MTEKLYRTVITYEVLSDRPVDHMDLSEIANECMEGDFSGMELFQVTEEVSEERMIALCEAQGSDPSFIMGERDEDDEEGENEEAVNAERESLAQSKAAMIEAISALSLSRKD